MQENNFGVIMAGGVGSRFWPMSKSAHPKQFMDILGTGRSLLQQTFDRLAKVCPPENIYIVTNSIYRDITLKQLPSISSDQVLCEPDRRNTAPCIAYAYMKIAGRNPNANIAITPSDHLIMNEAVFVQILTDALNYASSNDNLITVGITPSRPDTGYGYIHYNKDQQGFSQVRSFTEKPDLERAKAFVQSGEYSWNSGMFIWNVKSIDKAFQKFLPEMHKQFSAGTSKYNTGSEQEFVDEVYGKCESISIDYGIMEKADNVLVINAEFGWSDLGTWGSLYDHIPADDQGNALVAKNSLVFNSSGNIVHVPDNKLVVLQGLDDFIVVDHENALLICKKEDEQQIKKIVEALGKEYT